MIWRENGGRYRAEYTLSTIRMEVRTEGKGQCKAHIKNSNMVYYGTALLQNEWISLRWRSRDVESL